MAGGTHARGSREAQHCGIQGSLHTSGAWRGVAPHYLLVALCPRVVSPSTIYHLSILHTQYYNTTHTIYYIQLFVTCAMHTHTHTHTGTNRLHLGVAHRGISREEIDPLEDPYSAPLEALELDRLGVVTWCSVAMQGARGVHALCTRCARGGHAMFMRYARGVRAACKAVHMQCICSVYAAPVVASFCTSTM